MDEAPPTELTVQAAAQALRAELARGDAAIADARPVLHGLLARGTDPWLSEELVARVRGMITDLAGQLLLPVDGSSGETGPAEDFIRRQSDLAAELFEDQVVLAHVQSLALEARLIERLQARNGIDAVLPPLVQELVANSDDETAGLAMAVLAAQARFVQRCQRMQLSLQDLPGELLHKTLLRLNAHGGATGVMEEVEGRLALIERMVAGLDDAAAALDIEHAGVAVFATALAFATGQERDLVVMALTGGQVTRLALALGAAGLDRRSIERQLQHLDPALSPPVGIELIESDEARALLAASRPAVA